jgi:hypothetical protein
VLNLIDTFEAAELKKMNESYLSLALLSLDFLRLSSGFQP